MDLRPRLQLRLRLEYKLAAAKKLPEYNLYVEKNIKLPSVALSFGRVAAARVAAAAAAAVAAAAAA